MEMAPWVQFITDSFSPVEENNWLSDLIEIYKTTTQFYINNLHHIYTWNILLKIKN